jgi:hypothetical protein
MHWRILSLSASPAVECFGAQAGRERERDKIKIDKIAFFKKISFHKLILELSTGRAGTKLQNDEHFFKAAGSREERS